MPWSCPSLPVLLVTPLVVRTMCHTHCLCRGHAHCCLHTSLPAPFVAHALHRLHPLSPAPFVACTLCCLHPSLPAPFIACTLCRPRPSSPTLCVTPLITHVVCHAHCLCHGRAPRRMHRV